MTEAVELDHLHSLVALAAHAVAIAMTAPAAADLSEQAVAPIANTAEVAV